MRKLKIITLITLLGLCMLFCFACTTTAGGNAGGGGITVDDGPIKSLSLSNYKDQFAYGEQFSVGGLVVEVNYRDGSSQVVDDYLVNHNDYNSTTAGEYEIIIQYAEDNTTVRKSYQVVVNQSEVVEELQIKDLNAEYAFGEEFSFKGKVYEKYTDGRRVQVSNYSVDSSAYNGDVAGEYEIIISLNGHSVKYMAEVMPSMVVESYSVTSQTTTFEFGDDFLFDGVLNVEFDDGRVEEDFKDYVIDSSSYDPYKVGTYQISLTFGEDEVYLYNVEVEPASSLSVLLIGNSYSDDTNYIAPQIAESLELEEITIANLYIGGCTVDLHYTNAMTGAESYEFRCYDDGEYNRLVGNKLQSMWYGITYRDWDYIVIQQQSAMSADPGTYGRTLEGLISYVEEHATNPDVKLVWSMPWSYAEGYADLYIFDDSQIQMYNEISSAVQQKIVPNKAFVNILAIGTAVQNARTSYLGDTFNRDGTHLNYDKGCYIAGMVLVCGLTGHSPDAVTFVPEGLEERAVLVAKESVKNALTNKFEVTNSIYK